MHKVPLVICIPLRYIKTTAYITSPAERFYCGIMLLIGSIVGIFSDGRNQLIEVSVKSATRCFLWFSNTFKQGHRITKVLNGQGTKNLVKPEDSRELVFEDYFDKF